MNTKTTKALLQINILLDKEQKKLYDRYKDQKLAYNRKKKILKECLYYLEKIYDFTPEKNKLIEKIKNELEYPYYRHNWGIK